MIAAMNRRLHACGLSLLVWVTAATVGVPAVPATMAAGGSRRHMYQEPAPSNVDPLHAPFDRLLDLYVRDGFVYYRALKSDRGSFDRYISSLDVAVSVVDGWPRERQLAYWVNAYNAFVIETVLDRYPIRGRGPEYPANSVRQIPGAFDKLTHRAGGRAVTLDEIETRILSGLGDPRAFLALGRGSVGGGRLVSAAFTADRIETQLQQVVAECITRQECARLDVSARQLVVTPVFSWRQADFVKAYGQKEVAAYPGRSPIERAVLSLLSEHFLPGERQALRSNDFSVTFQNYDWRLNDLTGGPPPR
jgi:hypothetical protein